MCRLLRKVPMIKVEKSLLDFVFQNVVLLSAEEKKEQEIEMKEAAAEQIGIASLPKNEEDIEIIPVQEEEGEEAEMNFPEPPPDQEDSPVGNDSVP